MSRFAVARSRTNIARLGSLGAQRYLQAILLMLVISCAAFLLRAAFIGPSWDVFIDELTYLGISTNVVAGAGVTQYGRPFFLHPPAFFVLEAAYLWLLAPVGDLIQRLYLVRDLNAALAGLSAILIFQIGRVLSGWRGGLFAAVLFSLDPFVIRENSRNLLDTAAVFWILVGYVVLTSQPVHGRWIPSGRRSALAGLAFGLAILTKDMTIAVTLVPLVILALGDILARSRAIVAGGVAATSYLLYLLWVVWAGQWSQFWEQKLSGLARFAGLIKETGFRPGGPSFLDALLANVDVFGATYVLIALGVVAVVVMLRSADPRKRGLAWWTASAYALLGYSVALGTLEEQFFYYLVVPVIVAVPVAWSSIIRSIRLAFLRPGALARVAALVFVAWGGFVWTDVHLSPDNGYERLGQYLDGHVAPGAVLGAVTNPRLRASALTATLLFDGYRVEPISSISDICASSSEHVIVGTKQVDAGYVPNGREIHRWLGEHGELRFSFAGRSFGRLEMYALVDKDSCGVAR